MGKKEYKKGIESLRKEVDFHKDVKLKRAEQEGRTELVEYYSSEIKRMSNKIEEKQFKLLPRSKRIKLKKKLAKESKEQF